MNRLPLRGRITLGLIITACLIVGALCLMPGTQSNVAMAIIPVPNEVSSTADATPPHAGHAVRDKHVFTTEEIKERFPAAMHEEFMRRAIANSRKAGVQ